MAAITTTNNPANTLAYTTIEGLGTNGDGFFVLKGKKYFLPGTLPGERVAYRFTGDVAELIDVIEHAPERVLPPCVLADQCGGCAIQHMALPALLTWKTARIQSLLERVGFHGPAVEPNTYQSPPYSRRRVDLAVQRVIGGVHIGLHARNGNPVNMTTCHLLDPALFSLLGPLRHTLASLGSLTNRADLHINLLDTGPDLTLSTPAPLTPTDRMKLAALARAHNIPRISWKPTTGQSVETVAQSGDVRIVFGPDSVIPPPAAFLQATKESEAALRNAVLNGLPPLKRKDIIVELYAGCGTLTLPLSERGRVLAYEGDVSAAASLRAAAGRRRIDVHTRDLTRQPLLPQDLKSARLVVLDPPHAGSEPQITHLARSDVKDIIYVSCNPVALTKELPILHRAGFDLVHSTVIDQFLWSADVESVVVLSRDPKRIRRENSHRSRTVPSRSDC